ncbi:hypothetical protein V1358_10130 [Pseudoalteromonas sp. YIC-656]|uniref:hypothetical protein n=1 Tax=Pseudoalteromonas pernae TaxID=3118054 RepID=UPI00324275EF
MANNCEKINPHLGAKAEGELDAIMRLIYTSIKANLPVHKTQHPRYENAIMVIVTNVLCANEQNARLLVPKNRKYWLAQTQSSYGNSALGYTVMINSLRWLQDAGWIASMYDSSSAMSDDANDSSANSKHYLKASSQLLSITKHITLPSELNYGGNLLCVLRDNKVLRGDLSLSKLADIPANISKTQHDAVETFVRRLNNYVNSLNPCFDNQPANLINSFYLRIFNFPTNSEDTEFKAGGYYHNHWIQKLQHQDLKLFKLDACSVVELSFEGSLLALLYAQQGERIPIKNEEEYFDTVPDGFTNQSFMNKLTNELLCKNNIIVRKPSFVEQARPTIKWSKLIGQLFTLHPVLKTHAYTGIGKTLMFHSSQIYTYVMDDLMLRNIPFAYYNNSLLTTEQYEGLVADTMKDVFSFYTKEQFGQAIFSDIEHVPHR